MKHPPKNTLLALVAGLLSLFVCLHNANAQNNNSVRLPKRSTQTVPKNTQGGKKHKKGAKAKQYNEYTEARKKEMVKEARELEKPQYSNAMYFGHKRPPKKRPLHKRKMCKTCGIVH